ncbi:MAG: ROK family protein [Rikenellaceae bacterium]
MGQETQTYGHDSKVSSIKESILKYVAQHTEVTIANVAREINLSIPTIVKLINELIADGFLVDMGKHDSLGGRKPNVYGLKASNSYFVGVDVRHDILSFYTVDLSGGKVDSKDITDFSMKDTPENLVIIIDHIKDYIASLTINKKHIVTVGISLSGRINSREGRSNTNYNYEERPLAEIVSEKIGYNVILENDTKAITYGEYVTTCTDGEKDVLYVHVDWGLGLGLIFDGKLYYGKSGYSGEMGHAVLFDNQQICICGKRGCLETEVSGSALCRKIAEKYAMGESTILKDKLRDKGFVTLNEAIEAVKSEDMLSIEIVEQMGKDLGKFLAGILNILNPELLILGGKVSAVDNYLRLPVISTINKTSLNIVTSDTTIRTSTLGEKAGVVGIAMLARNRYLGLC